MVRSWQVVVADAVDTPERPSWQRPPFEPGHTLSMQHGAYSRRRVDPLAVAYADSIIAADPELGTPRWAGAVWALARSEAQVELLGSYLALAGERSGDSVGDLADPRVLAAYSLLHKAETRAHALRGRLGLDPLSAARLGRDRASASLDMAALMKALADRDDRPGAFLSASDGIDGDQDDTGFAGTGAAYVFR